MKTFVKFAFVLALATSVVSCGKKTPATPPVDSTAVNPETTAVDSSAAAAVDSSAGVDTSAHGATTTDHAPAAH